MTKPLQTIFHILLITLLAGVLVAGCGRKGPPLPPVKQPAAETETEKKEEEAPPEPTGLPQDTLEEEHDTPAVPPYP